MRSKITLAWGALEGPRFLHVARKSDHHDDDPAPFTGVVVALDPRGCRPARFGGAAAVVPHEAAKTQANTADAPIALGLLDRP